MTSPSPGSRFPPVPGSPSPISHSLSLKARASSIVSPQPLNAPRPIVSFQGERGAYGDLAIEQRWGANALRIRCWDFEGVVAAVASGAADFGVLPLHNVIIGEIPGVREIIARTALRELDEVMVPVRHCVLALPGASFTTLRELFSHPSALAQCRALFHSRSSLQAREAYDTAGAAREVAARRHPWEGAIASEECAAHYGLRVVARDVGDRADNVTRFVVVARDAHDGV